MSDIQTSGSTPFDIPLQPLFAFAAYFNITIVQTTVSKLRPDGEYSFVNPSWAISDSSIAARDLATDSCGQKILDNSASGQKQDRQEASMFRTPFGLEVFMLHASGRSRTGRVCLRARAEESDSSYYEDAPYHYQLVPGERTATLEYDVTWRAYPDCALPPFDDENILARHPALGSFYREWADEYKMATLDQDCSGELGLPVFPVRQQRVAWEVAGHLMACWLLLQPGVESVRYMLITADGHQNMTLDVIPEALAELMRHETYVLRGRDPRTFVSVAISCRNAGYDE